MYFDSLMIAVNPGRRLQVILSGEDLEPMTLIDIASPLLANSETEEPNTKSHIVSIYCNFYAVDARLYEHKELVIE